MKRRMSMLVILALLACSCASSASDMTMILGPVPIAKGNVGVFNTPVGSWSGNVYVATVEPGPDSGSGYDLQTVIRKGMPDGEGEYIWERVVLEDRTIDDPWHTQPSIGIDKNGCIHVAYNMHHLPWQYSVSRIPGDIESMEFRGQPLTSEQIRTYAVENKTPFPSKGSAAIPGNQITYPAFFTDQLGELYVTYRYAVHPARPWGGRLFAGGVAKYSFEAGGWVPIGGDYPLEPDSISDYDLCGPACFTYPFCVEEGYVAYNIELAFDRKGGMHAIWTWREHSPGGDVGMPSHVYLKDCDGIFRAPFGIRNVEHLVPWNGTRFYAQISVALDEKERPYVLLNPIKGKRYVVRKQGGRWEWFSDAPHGSTRLSSDLEGTLYAFASGPKVFIWSKPKKKWVLVSQFSGWFNPRVSYSKSLGGFLIYCNDKNENNVSVFFCHP